MYFPGCQVNYKKDFMEVFSLSKFCAKTFTLKEQ